LTTGQWLKIIDELAELKVFQVKLLAGEPLIRQDLETILQHIVCRNMRFTLNTNGTLMTEELAQFISRTGRADEIQISIDGLEKNHDEIRGSGNWRKAVNAVKLLKKYCVPAKINMVLTTSNYTECVEASRYLLENTGADILRISSVSDEFNDLAPAQDRLSDSQYAETMLQIRELKKQFPNITSSFLERYEQITHPSDREGFRRCSTPYKSITIRADGAVIACPNAREHVLGWCGRDDLTDIWQKSPVITKFRKEIDDGSNLVGACSGCKYIRYCGQCCPAARRREPVRCLKKLEKLIQERL
jgi:radical SAM protein with 4Fe4S-binding SPASM domain